MSEEAARDRTSSVSFLFPAVLESSAGAAREDVQFYRDESLLVDAVASFVGAGLRRGDGVLVLASELHVQQLRAALRTTHPAVQPGPEPTRLLVRDAASTVANVQLDGLPNEALFRLVLGELVRVVRAASLSGRVRVYTEMVELSKSGGNAVAVLRLEELWSRLAEEQSLELLCGYRGEATSSEERRSTLEWISRRLPAAPPEPPLRAAESTTRVLELERRAEELMAELERSRSREGELQQRYRAEREASRRAARLLSVTSALAETMTPEDIGEVGLRSIVEVLDAEIGSLSVVSADGSELHTKACAGIQLEQLGPLQRLPMSAAVPAAKAIRSGAPVYVQSAEERDRSFPVLEGSQGFRAGTRVAVPLFVAGKAVASMNLAFGEWRVISNEEREFIAAVAEQCALAFERAGLYESERAARREAEQRKHEGEILFRLSQAANGCHQLEDIYEPALSAVCALLGVDRAAILLFDDSSVMRFSAWRGLSERYRRAVEGHSPWGPADPDPRPIWVMDAGQDAALSDYRALFEAEKIGSLGFVPLLQRGQLLGKFMVYGDVARVFSSAEEQLAVTVAAEIAQAVARSRLMAAERAARDEAEELARRSDLLQRITAALSGASTLADVSAIVVAQGAAAVGAATGGLWLTLQDESAAELVHYVGYSAQVEHYRRIRLDSGAKMPVSDAIRSGSPLWIDGRGSFATLYPELTSAVAARPEIATACLPMLIEGRCLGALAFTFDEFRAFPDDEKNFLSVLTQHCAQALARARMFERESRARSDAEAAQRRSAFLLEAGTLLASSLDFQETLNKLAGLAVPRIADWCSIDMRAEAGEAPEQLTVVHADAAKVASAREYRQRYPIDPEAPRGLAHVLRSGEPVLVQRVTDELLAKTITDPEQLRLLRSLGMRSVMIAPITARDRVFGAITFVAAESERHYDEKDLELAELLGRRAGIAIDNALLYEAAQRATRVREEVLAIVSHDLRNPLSVIVMNAASWLGLSGEALPGDAVRQSAALIRRSAERMSRLIDDLLDFSSIAVGRLAIEPSACRPEEIANETVEMFSASAEDRQLCLQARIGAELPAVECDRDRVLQAFGNLVSNAVKVTPSGGTITIGAAWQGNEVVFSVDDTGPGLRPEELGRVFERYWRSERSNYRGTGLGLAIARGIVEAHGGRLWGESTFGQGSRFCIALPLARA